MRQEQQFGISCLVTQSVEDSWYAITANIWATVGGGPSVHPTDVLVGSVGGGYQWQLICCAGGIAGKGKENHRVFKEKWHHYHRWEGAQGNVLVFFCNTCVLKDVVHSSMPTWRECLGARRSISMMFWWKPFSCFDKQLVQPKIIVKLLGVESTILSKQFKRTPALMTMMRMLVTLTEMARWCFVSSVVTFECPRAKPLSCIARIPYTLCSTWL